MDAKRNAGDFLALAGIWEDLDPSLLEPALTEMQTALFGSDPLESLVRDRVLARIGYGEMPNSPNEGSERPVKGDPKNRFSRWPFQSLARMAAAVILVVAAVWLISMPFLRYGGTATTTAGTTAAATTAATTAAGTTAAGATTAGTTAAATASTSTAATTAATTAAGTSAATTGATAPTSAATTTGTTPAEITWPASLKSLLGFDDGQVRAIRVQRYGSSNELEDSVTLTDRQALDSVAELLGRVELDRPATGAVQPVTGRYDLVFELAPGSATPAGTEQRLLLAYQEDQNIIMVSGSFLDRLGIQAPNGLRQANPGLTLFEIRNKLDSLLR